MTEQTTQPAPIAFCVHCNPPTATAQQKGVCVRGGRVHFFTKAKVRATENTLLALFAPYAPAVPFTFPLALSVRWVFPFRKSEKRSVVREGVDIPHTSRPDLDNLEKALLDVLTLLGFWADDSLVAEKHTAKYWGKSPRIEIRIESTAHAPVKVLPKDTALAPIGRDNAQKLRDF